MRALTWLLRVLIFVALFAFALNNQHDAALKGFFGQEWRAPMVFIVLGAFGIGCALGILAMLPSWWKHKRGAQQQRSARPDTATTMLDVDAAREADPAIPEHPPRDGL
ncbi:lipopolysaccharide assembly LapA domain-containing protein [uncultured Methylibium sp.]|uniref:LapA family protein n=1 Tax=uncultured Methylibium sp. TaxID=381093 RepID=UPI0025EB447C|nr:LapA family protein [uncultured Methylibium sp.]